MDEQLLQGGRQTAGVVRVGDTVRRPLHPRSEFVHAVLQHLEAAGFAGAPRVLGVDEAGREVLTGRLCGYELLSASIAQRQAGIVLGTGGQPLITARSCQ